MCALTLAENRPLEPFLLPPERSALDWAPILRLKDSSDTGQARGGKYAVVYYKTNNNGNKTENQPPSRGEEENSPR